MVERVVEQRRESDLPIDPESVQRAIVNSERPEYPLPGLFFTPEEQADEESVDRQLGDRAEAILIDAGAEIGRVEWCWRNSRRGVTISVKGDVTRYQDLLIHELGTDRVIVTQAPLSRYSERELRELSDRISADRDELAELGIEIAMLGPGDGEVGLGYFAADRKDSERVLTERYGPALDPSWLGRESVAEEPHPFGSWIAEDRRLTVFYALPHDCAPGTCTVQELPDRVIVSLTIRVPQLIRAEGAGFKPSHATIELDTPLGERIVVDNAHNVERPEWRGNVRR